jgi:acyl carrier protein
MPFTPGGTIFGKVVLAVEQTLHIEGNTLSPATRLVDDLLLGRFDRIRLAMHLEETFDLEIPDDAIECFATVGDIALYLSRWSLGTPDVSAQSWLRA